MEIGHHLGVDTRRIHTRTGLSEADLAAPDLLVARPQQRLLDQVRLGLAKRLLATGMLSVEDVAQHLC